MKRLVIVGAWIGLVYGAVEGLEVMSLSLIPGALSWRNGNSADVLWFAPLFYGLAFGLLALPFVLIGGIAKRLPIDAIFVFVLVAGCGFLALTLPSGVLSDLAAGILAVGIASQVVRLFRRHRGRWEKTMTRSLPWLLATVVLVGVAVRGSFAIRERMAMAGLPSANPRSPNVLLIVLDTQRADHLSAYGYERPTSPNLEALAVEGVLFERAHANSSWTLPSHATLFTEKRLVEHRAGEIRRPYLDGRFPTLAEVLRLRGYATAGFVGNIFWCGRQTGLQRGFLHYEDFYGSPGDAFARTALGRRIAYEGLPRFGLIDVPGRKYAAEINDDFLGWVDRNRDRPFFAFVNYFDVHGPYLPPPPFAGRFTDAADAGRRSVKEIQLGALTGDITVPGLGELEQLVGTYDESIAYLDAQLGRLFEQLERRGVLDETLVIVTSDHGESFGEHELMYHGHSLYHEQTHVPLVLRYPGVVPSNTRISTPVGLERIPATVMEVVGSKEHPFTAPSLSENWHGGDGDGGLVVTEVARRSTVPYSWPSSRGWSRSVITDRWQLIVRESGDTELYDVVSDRSERHNLAETEEGRVVVVDLRGRLDRVLPDLEDRAARSEPATGSEPARASASTPLPSRSK